jgi:O-antigen/teichoic acid export membrane protein
MISSALGAVVVAAALLVGRPVLELGFGERFAAAHWALVILMAAAAAQLVSHTYALYVQVFVSPARLFLIYLLATLVFAISAPPLTLWLSIEGTALAQVAFALSLTFMGAFILRRSPRFGRTSGDRRISEGAA